VIMFCRIIRSERFHTDINLSWNLDIKTFVCGPIASC